MKHSPLQQEKLWESAQHYLENWQDPTNAQIYAEDCPCCVEFLDVQYCNDCPIAIHTGESACRGTPWAACSIAKDGPGFADALEKEYVFLVGLVLGENP